MGKPQKERPPSTDDVPHIRVYDIPGRGIDPLIVEVTIDGTLHKVPVNFALQSWRQPGRPWNWINRWLFECPQCKGRKAQLYLFNGKWACQKCQGLVEARFVRARLKQLARAAARRKLMKEQRAALRPVVPWTESAKAKPARGLGKGAPLGVGGFKQKRQLTRATKFPLETGKTVS